MVARAHEIELDAIAIADTNTFAGIVRGHAAAKEVGLRYIVGVRLILLDGAELIAFPTGRAAYGRFCRLLTTGKRRTVKGQCDLTVNDVIEWGEGSVFIISGDTHLFAIAERLQAAFEGNVFIGLGPHYDGEDDDRFEERQATADRVGVLTVAIGRVVMHHGRRRRLADVLSCIREKTTIDKLGRLAQPNNERRLFKDYPRAVQKFKLIAERCTFSLDELRHEYPDEITDGMAPNDRLRKLTEEGLERRYPDGVALNVRALVEKELTLIADLDYARYFLTVHDIVAFARSKNILCQGRGSAANSVVCYALGITEASPETISMMFERFISAARNEPPDIDVDFEHERREEVIQHVYEKYGRHRAGICSTAIHFRSRAEIREVGKAMGLSEDAVAALSSQVCGTSNTGIADERAKAAGLDLDDPRLRQTLELTKEIVGFPRHLSQHVGGFVITRGRLDELCPVENAAMDDRTIIE